MIKETTETITVEVAYALPHTQVIISLQIPAGTTAQAAIELSQILQQFPDIQLAESKIGVFGKMIHPDAVLNPMDRVEIYRPLIANAKEARRLRAKTKNKTAIRTDHLNTKNRA